MQLKEDVMFGWNFRKSLIEKMLNKKLIEVKDKKINLLNCKDIDTQKVYESCSNRKQKRVALITYFKEVRTQARKEKRQALTLLNKTAK